MQLVLLRSPIQGWVRHLDDHHPIPEGQEAMGHQADESDRPWFISELNPFAWPLQHDCLDDTVLDETYLESRGLYWEDPVLEP